MVSGTDAGYTIRMEQLIIILILPKNSQVKRFRTFLNPPMRRKVKTKDDIVHRILGAQQQLALLGVRCIGLFGSFVRSEQTDSSDIDLLVEFLPEKHSFDNFMDAAFLLEDLLGRKVEIVTPEALSPHIGPHILKEVECV